MFNFIVRYFGFLKHIPVVPHVYDALLTIKIFLTNRDLLNSFDHIEQTVCGWENVNISAHQYGGIQFNLGDSELGHLHGNGLLDVLLNRQLKAELMRNPSVQQHHVFKNSGWISFHMKSSADQQLAVAILEQAYRLRNAALTTR